MKREFELKTDRMYLPVVMNGENIRVHIYREGQKVYEFQIPWAKGRRPDRFVGLPASAGIWEICAEGGLADSFLERIGGEHEEYTALIEESDRPLLHFSPSFGWLNDPNGLLFFDGMYHLFYQYNPFDVNWENMSWGHSVSSDLVSWEEMEPALYPDDNGTVFSGCGLVNERGCFGLPKDALLLFYTAAGGANEWSEGRQFTQRMAYSLDGGQTFVKWPEVIVDTVSFENRDPKIFWHSPTQSYIMVLWIKENEFAVFRSSDLQKWRRSQSIVLPEAWECPDLFCIEEKWYFWAADGYYFAGSFDGYEFRTDGKLHRAYFNKVPYAAQTIFFPGEDMAGGDAPVITIPWLRLPCSGRIFTGVMGIPRKISRHADGERLCFEPVDTVKSRMVHVENLSEITKRDGIYMVLDAPEDFCVNVDGTEIRYICDASELTVGDEKTPVEWIEGEMALLIDQFVLEVSVNHGTMTAAFPMYLPDDDARGGRRQREKTDQDNRITFDDKGGMKRVKKPEESGSHSRSAAWNIYRIEPGRK